MKSYFPNTEVLSSDGKDNILTKLLEILKQRQNLSLLIIVDSCAFGLRIEDIIYIVEQLDNVHLLLWKCFEEYLLRAPNIVSRHIKSCIFEKDYETLLKKYIDYQKRSLSHCISLEDSCNNCNKKSVCNCQVYGDRTSNYIHSELLNINQGQTTVQTELKPMSWE